MRPFLSRYPQFFAGSAEFRDLQQAQEPELLELWAAWDSALEQLCADTATWGLSYWEKTLGLPVEEEKGLDVRRNRVKARLLGTEVTTVELVRKLAESFAGGEASVTEYTERFWVELGFPGVNGVPPDWRGLAASLREIMPAHLGWGLAFSYETDASLSIAAHTELNTTLDLWPRMVNELESTGIAAVAGMLDYQQTLDLWPQVVNELESAGTAAVAALLDYQLTLELWPIETKEESA